MRHVKEILSCQKHSVLVSETFPVVFTLGFFPPIITDHCIILICSGYETDELRSCCICGSLCIGVHCVKSCCMTPANICCNSNKVNLAHVLVQFALAHFAAI